MPRSSASHRTRLGVPGGHSDRIPSSNAGAVGESDEKRGQRRTAAAAIQDDPGPRKHSRHQSLYPRAAGRPGLAPFPRGDAALDRRHRDTWDAGSAGHLLFVARHGPHRRRTVGPHHRALQCIRAVRALDDGGLLHHPCAFRPQYHPRSAAAAPVDEAGSFHGLFGMGEIRTQLSELPLHPRRRADFPDVARRQHPDAGRY